jgi:hypothetical protein
MRDSQVLVAPPGEPGNSECSIELVELDDEAGVWAGAFPGALHCLSVTSRSAASGRTQPTTGDGRSRTTCLLPRIRGRRPPGRPQRRALGNEFR